MKHGGQHFFSLKFYSYKMEGMQCDSPNFRRIFSFPVPRPGCCISMSYSDNAATATATMSCSDNAATATATMSCSDNAATATATMS